MKKNEASNRSTVFDLSVIIPVYNVEKYLRECVDSVVFDAPKYNVEIVLVDDGSTDDSGAICDGYAEKFSEYVAVFHKPNGGLSDARNWGISHARGKYVCFLDSDDYYAPDTLKSLCEEIESGCEVYAGCGYTFSDESKELSAHEHIVTLAEDVKNCDGREALEKILSLHPTFGWYAWRYVIKREFLIRNELFFKKGILFEDFEWTPRVYFAAERVAVLNKPFYCYRLLRKGSIMAQKNTAKKCVDRVEAMKSHLEYIEKSDFSDKFKECLFRNFAGTYTSIMDGQMYVKDKSVHNDVKSMQMLLKYAFHPAGINVRDIYLKRGYASVFRYYRRKVRWQRFKETIKKLIRK